MTLKRSAILRKSPLKRHTQLRSRPAPINRNDPARIAWKTPRAGFCECCGRFAMHLEHHHVIELQAILREGRTDLAYDPRDGMYLHPQCHARHTSAFRRIPLEKVPESALAFAVDLLGEDRAALYIARAYSTGRAA